MSGPEKPTPSFPSEETESQEIGDWLRSAPHSTSEAEEMDLLQKILLCLLARGTRKDNNYIMT